MAEAAPVMAALGRIASGQGLSEAEAEAAFAAILRGEASEGQIGALLMGLAVRGETVAELAGAVRAMRAAMRPVPGLTEAIDVCGTGGDRLGTLNVSTAVAFVVAGAGVTVAKHGNRAATSRCGSADVAEALGLRLDLAPEEAARSLREHGFAFFFAPTYHPAFKHVAAARKLCAERGQRTIFNILGPLLNPARPTAQLVGVPRPALCGPLARVLQMLGVRRAMVVCGCVRSEVRGSESAGAELDRAVHAPRPPFAEDTHLDELSPLGENTIAEFYQERGFAQSVLTLDPFPLQPASLADLAGGDAAANAGIIRRILRGEERGPKRDAVLLNAAAALWVAGRARSLSDGWDLAEEVIDCGRAAAKLRAVTNR